QQNYFFMMNGVKIEILFQIVIFTLAISVLYVSISILKMPLALLLIFLFILVRLTDPLRSLNSQRHVITGELASLEKIDEIVTQMKQSVTIRNGLLPFTKFTDRITLDYLYFSYIPNSPVITNISFEVKKNEMVALIGASGSGKSTMADLVIRLMDPDAGEIRIDGTDIKKFDLASYHGRIGIVSQESYIFRDTIANNIYYGCDHRSTDLAVEVARLANAHDFIMNLPDGYNTVIGEKGVTLSGGEKQRISLARALYKNPEILILDEATSALDSESEKVILDAIGKIKNKYTIIAIAHRLSTIENADRIIAIEKGKIVESGTHKFLMQEKGLYWKYYSMQHDGNGTSF
ncbi:MAG: ATP-binding cassette domain-containing protein, partial [Methanoregula sp.]|nr:ATP-binding cassette domain-containing protein [Methanoregula sp.]